MDTPEIINTLMEITNPLDRYCSQVRNSNEQNDEAIIGKGPSVPSISTTGNNVNNSAPVLDTPEILDSLMEITHNPLDDDYNNINKTRVTAEECKEKCEVTPDTPEIINCIISIANPLDKFYHQPSCTIQPKNNIDNKNGIKIMDNKGDDTDSNDTINSNSVQNMRSRLIKEGLKLTLQKKKVTTPVTDDASSDDALYIPSMDDEYELDHEQFEQGQDQEHDQFSFTGLTMEDEERRRRRRERNKVAATKCRMKKREKTVNLAQESQQLENMNETLRNQITALEVQRKNLMDVLVNHKSTCIRGNRKNTFQQHHVMYTSC